MKVTLLTHTPNPEKVVEAAARQCYSSLDAQQIYDKPSKPAEFLKRIPTTHASFIEHASFTFAIEGISRACSHQLVRHRIASYCLSGDTVLVAFKRRKRLSPKRWTISQLYEWQSDPQRKGRLKLINLRSVDSDGILIPGKIKNIFYTGRREVFEVRTRCDRSIKATAEHRFITPEGWKRLEELSVGDRVLANGIPAYQNPEWLREMYLCCPASVENGYRIVKHHRDGNTANNSPENIIPFCEKCHRAHETGQAVDAVYSTIIESIEPAGMEETYDIEMDEPYHNFVANGFVVHNSQQSQRYVSAENFEYVTPQTIIDVGLKEWYEGVMQQMKEWYTFVLDKLTQSGLKKEAAQQDARFLLPNATATKIVVTMNARSLLHFFEVRLCDRAQWEIRTLAQKMLDLVKPIAPTIFRNAGPLCEQIGKCPEGVMACENVAVHLKKYRQK